MPDWSNQGGGKYTSPPPTPGKSTQEITYKEAGSGAVITTQVRSNQLRTMETKPAGAGTVTSQRQMTPAEVENLKTQEAVRAGVAPSPVTPGSAPIPADINRAQQLQAQRDAQAAQQANIERVNAIGATLYSQEKIKQGLAANASRREQEARQIPIKNINTRVYDIVKYQEPKERIISPTSVKIYEAAHRVSDTIGSFEKIADTGAARISEHLSPQDALVYNAAYKLGKGMFLETPKGLVETAGMIPGGIEAISKKPELLPSFIITGATETTKGMAEGFTKNPLETAGTIIGTSAIMSYGAEKLSKINIPYKVSTGKPAGVLVEAGDIQAVKSPVGTAVTTKEILPGPEKWGVFAEPVKEGKAAVYIKPPSSAIENIRTNIAGQIDYVSTKYGSFMRIKPFKNIEEPTNLMISGKVNPNIPLSEKLSPYIRVERKININPADLTITQKEIGPLPRLNRYNWDVDAATGGYKPETPGAPRLYPETTFATDTRGFINVGVGTPIPMKTAPNIRVVPLATAEDTALSLRQLNLNTLAKSTERELSKTSKPVIGAGSVIISSKTVSVGEDRSTKNTKPFLGVLPTSSIKPTLTYKKEPAPRTKTMPASQISSEPIITPSPDVSISPSPDINISPGTNKAPFTETTPGGYTSIPPLIPRIDFPQIKPIINPWEKQRIIKGSGKQFAFWSRRINPVLDPFKSVKGFESDITIGSGSLKLGSMGKNNLNINSLLGTGNKRRTKKRKGRR